MWSHSDLPLNAGKRFNKHYYFLGLELRLQAEVENLKLKLQKQGNTIRTLKKQVQISRNNWQLSSSENTSHQAKQSK